MITNAKDLATCGIFIAFGVFFAATALGTLDVGSAMRMGPGYFPLLLAGLLILIGIVIGVRGFVSTSAPLQPAPWRAVLMISLAPIIFGVTVRGLGLPAAIFLSTCAAAMASRRMSVPRAVIVSGAIAVFSTAVFVYALRLPMPVVGSWLSGS